MPLLLNTIAVPFTLTQFTINELHPITSQPAASYKLFTCEHCLNLMWILFNLYLDLPIYFLYSFQYCLLLMFIITTSQPNPAHLFHTYFAIEKHITLRYTATVVSITLFLSRAK